MLFSPACEHCQHEAEEMVKYKDHLKSIQIIMSTNYPISDMQAFYEKYNLSSIHDIVVGQDYQYILPPFFSMKNFPFIALYDRKKELISAFEGAVPMPKIIEAFEK